MPYYFSNFPKINYQTNGNISIPLVDITRRFRLKETVLKNKYILFKYNILQQEKPRTVANKLYGDPTLDWIILITNEMIDPFFDWPLEDEEFENYIRLKYGSTEKAKTDIYAYQHVLQAKEQNLDGSVVPEKTINVDSTAFQNLPANVRRRISYYDFERKINEDKREIRVIDSRYIPSILEEYNKLYGNS